ncbi:MAG: FAD-dependent oxidoreductase [Alphaproteobacteria bacterium]
MNDPALFPRLFSPFRVREVELRNRIVSTAHGTTTSVGGLPTEATAAYHAARSRGGVGLIILEAAAVHETGVYNDRFLSCHHDDAVPGFRHVAEAVHAHGARVFGQLFHAGASMRGQRDGLRLVPVAPSYSVAETSRQPARSMSLTLIREVIQAFGNAAARMMAAGLDGIEINGRNGNLPAQFLNPRINVRTDDYGGDFRRRLRFLAEIVEEVRGRIGDRVPLGLRVSAAPMDALGLTPDEVVDACTTLAPAIDFFDVIAGAVGTYAGLSHIVPPMGMPGGYTAEGAAAIRAATGRPVLVAGRITRPELAERLLAEGQADLCGMTRALIADPDLPNKARTGRADQIRVCIGCNQACIGHEPMGVPVSCIQYPESGRELVLLPRTHARHIRRVIVAGGGPAGLKAAAVAAERGHLVKLFERERQFGGQALVAAMIPGRGEFGGLVSNLVREARASGAELVSGSTVDVEMIRRENPDAVIVATGAVPSRSAMPEVEGMAAVDAGAVLDGTAKITGRVVIADERADWVGMGVAENLAREGCRVTLCVMADVAGQGLDNYTRFRWLGILHGLGVEIVPHVRLVGASRDAIVLRHVASLVQVERADVDALVLALHPTPVVDLRQALEGQPFETHVIGDCLAPRTAEEAVYEGLVAGLAV